MQYNRFSNPTLSPIFPVLCHSLLCTAATYIKQFPGLVHFMYCNRATQIIEAPALIPFRQSASNLNSSQANPSHQPPTIKQLVWALYHLAMGRLRQGYTTVMKKSGDFSLSYFLWFEDSSGMRLTPPALALTTPVPMEVVGGDFYRALIDAWFPAYSQRPGQVMCFELFTIHTSMAPFEFIAKQG